MSSRKSSISQAQPIQMPDDCRDAAGNDSDLNKIEILLNPTDHHVINCNGDAAADVPLNTDEDDDDDDKDVHVNAVL